MATNLNFETFAQEAHEYVNFLAQELGHPEEKERVLIIWRAVMHTVRDRIDKGESFQIIAPLPMIFKGIYVEDWKYSEKPPLQYESIQQMKDAVKTLQEQYGEQEFSWKKPTEEIISITLHSLTRYMPNAQLDEIIEQFPKEIQKALHSEV